MNKIYALLVLLVVLASSCKDPCDDVTCNGNGVCLDGTCLCDDGFEGVNCEKDLCADVNCNDGNCVNGDCECDEGFEGENCEFAERDKFIGTWSGDVMCEPAIPTGESTIIITADPADGASVLFSLDFELLPLEPVSGTVVGKKVFITADTQEIDFMGFPVMVTIGGDGEYNDDGTISMNISLANAISPISCSGLLSPQ